MQYQIYAEWHCGYSFGSSFPERPNLTVFQSFNIFTEMNPHVLMYGPPERVLVKSSRSRQSIVLGMLITYAADHGHCEMWVASYYCAFFLNDLPPARWMNYEPLPCKEWFIRELHELIESYE